MLICLDYDNTYTLDPRLWMHFIKSAIRRGHEVICCTMRYKYEAAGMCPELTSTIHVFYSGRLAKKPFLSKVGIEPDVWIDDSPHWIVQDALDS